MSVYVSSEREERYGHTENAALSRVSRHPIPSSKYDFIEATVSTGSQFILRRLGGDASDSVSLGLTASNVVIIQAKQ